MPRDPIARVAARESPRASRRRKKLPQNSPRSFSTGTKKNIEKWTMNPDEISNEDYVVDSDEIMEDATQETNTQNDKEIEKLLGVRTSAAVWRCRHAGEGR